MTTDFRHILGRSIGRTSVLAMVALTLVGLLVHSARSTVPATIDTQIVQLPSQVHDFGIVMPLSKSKFTFISKNSFPGVLTIDKIDRSCGCTAARCDRSVVPPGQELSVDAILSAHDHLESMSSLITVHGHVGQQAIEVEYQLLANVENIIEFPNNGGSYLSLGSWPVYQLPAVTSLQVVRGKYPLVFDQLRVECDSSALVATVEPVNGASWNVLFRIKSADVLGATGFPVTFRFVRKGQLLPESVTRQAFAEILGPVAATPTSLLFTLAPGEHVEKTIQITHRLNASDSPPPQIVAVDGNSTRAVATSKNDPQQSCVILDYTASKQPGSDRGEIVISVIDQGRPYKIKVSFLALIS
jgi:hypothetical protein